MSAPIGLDSILLVVGVLTVWQKYEGTLKKLKFDSEAQKKQPQQAEICQVQKEKVIDQYSRAPTASKQQADQLNHCGSNKIDDGFMRQQANGLKTKQPNINYGDQADLMASNKFNDGERLKHDQSDEIQVGSEVHLASNPIKDDMIECQVQTMKAKELDENQSKSVKIETPPNITTDQYKNYLFAFCWLSSILQSCALVAYTYIEIYKRNIDFPSIWVLMIISTILGELVYLLEQAFVSKLIFLIIRNSNSWKFSDQIDQIDQTRIIQTRIIQIRNSLHGWAIVYNYFVIYFCYGPFINAAMLDFVTQIFVIILYANFIFFFKLIKKNEHQQIKSNLKQGKDKINTEDAEERRSVIPYQGGQSHVPSNSLGGEQYKAQVSLTVESDKSQTNNKTLAFMDKVVEAMSQTVLFGNYFLKNDKS